MMNRNIYQALTLLFLFFSLVPFASAQDYDLVIYSQKRKSIWMEGFLHLESQVQAIRSERRKRHRDICIGFTKLCLYQTIEFFCLY